MSDDDDDDDDDAAGEDEEEEELNGDNADCLGIDKGGFAPAPFPPAAALLAALPLPFLFLLPEQSTQNQLPSGTVSMPAQEEFKWTSESQPSQSRASIPMRSSPTASTNPYGTQA